MPKTSKRLSLRIGMVVEGRKRSYRIKERLNAGANGIVFRASALDKDEMVALKVFSPRDAVSPAEMERLRRSFKNELIKTRVLSHWGVVDVLDSGTTTINRRRVPFVVMELAPSSLREALKNNSLGRFARFFYSALLCEIIDYINARGQIHRDIKPENLLFDKFGLLKVADLGIAEFIPEFEEKAFRHYGGYTEEIDARHPRHYFSPEQLRRALDEKDVDLSMSDCFQLGKVIHEMLTGINPVGQLNWRDRRYTNVPATVRDLLESMLAHEASKRPHLWACAAVLHAEAEESLIAAHSKVSRLRKYDKKILAEWFSKNNLWDPGSYVGDRRAEDFMQRMTRSGITEVVPKKEEGWWNFIALTPFGQDVRDILLGRSSWPKLVKLFAALNRSPIKLPPPWGDPEWLSFNPRRRFAVEMVAFLPLKRGQWDAWIICPPMKLDSGWWVEIYSGEMPLPQKEQQRMLPVRRVEWLVPVSAPRWVKRGATLQKALHATASELIEAGIARSKVKKALAKFHRQPQPPLSKFLYGVAAISGLLALERVLKLEGIIKECESFQLDP